MKNAKLILLLTGLAFVACISTITKARAQAFSYSAQVSWTKFDIDRDSRDIVLFPKGYHNGFELGPLVTYRPKPSPFAFTTGVLFNAMYYDYFNYSLYFLSTPLGFKIEIGKKAGVVIGFGIKGWYLLKVPERILEYHQEEDVNRFYFSFTAQLGVFFKVNELRFQLCPQIESIKTPLYSEKQSSAPGHWATHNYYISMVSYNLTVSF